MTQYSYIDFFVCLFVFPVLIYYCQYYVLAWWPSRRFLACVDASLEFVRIVGKTDFTASMVSFVKCPNDPISMVS